MGANPWGIRPHFMSHLFAVILDLNVVLKKPEIEKRINCFDKSEKKKKKDVLSRDCKN